MINLSNTTITYIVGGAAGVLGLLAYSGWILVPAWRSYSGVWQRVVASVLSLYVLAVFVGAGVLGGLAVIYFWDRL